MRIALVGYGRMGKAIEAIAIERGHEISARFTSKNTNIDAALKESSDVAIEFTSPSAAFSNLSACAAHGIPVVTGTTGWFDQLNAIEDLVDEHKGSLLYASNFSIGMNLFMAANRYLAERMNLQSDYSAHIHEIHHVHKLDAPSGTAITLAEELVGKVDRYTQWSTEHKSDDSLPVSDERIGEVPGTHTITWENEIDKLSFTHEAKNRKGFALGAVLAAEWLVGKQGVFTMRDMLQL